MFCPNCGNNIPNKADFCPNCGTNLKDINNEVKELDNVSEPTTSETVIVNDNEEKNQKNKPKIILIILIVLVLIGGAIFGDMMFFNKKPNNNNTDNKEEQSEEVNVKLNSLEKINEAYENGTLNANDYFKELVYLMYDSSKLDKKYTSDYKDYIFMDEINIDEFLESHINEIDIDIAKYYLTNKLMLNVKLGSDNPVAKQNNRSDNYRVVPLDNKKDDSNVINHKLDKVYLSKNKHFLIWYTDTGDDATTDKQLKTIADTLENTISKYEEIFEITYSYEPYFDNIATYSGNITEEWQKALNTLSANDLPSSVLNEAMSIYIYNVPGTSNLASYNDEKIATKVVNRVFGNLNFDGIINYPYILINNNTLNDNIEPLIQIVNHELFHHFQHIICEKQSSNICPSGDVIDDATANLASALVSDSKNTDNMLNGWAGIYTKKTSTKLSDITNKNGSPGYALFPYFYSFTENVTDWEKIIVNVHNEEKPFEYIMKNTPKDELIKTINHLALYTLSQDYDNKALISHEGITLSETLKNSMIYNVNVSGGSINYYDLGEVKKLKVSFDNTEYLTIKIYGLKNKKYEELASYNKSTDIDTSSYTNYDKLYLAVTNGNLIETYDYSIETENVITPGKTINNKFQDKFKNYDVEIDLNTKIAGIEVKQYSKGVIDETHQKEYLKIDTTTMGFTISTEMYYDLKTGYSYMSQPYSAGTWIKSKDGSQVADLKGILDKLNNMKNVTKITDNHFRVKMTKDDVKGLMSSANSDVSIITGDIYADVYTENGYITKLEYDLAKITKGIDVFTATVKFSNYNNAGDVEIPKTVIDSAK